MLFQQSKSKKTKNITGHMSDVLMYQSCNICPLAPFKGPDRLPDKPLDVLIIAPKTPHSLCQHLDLDKVAEIFLVECVSPYDKTQDPAAKTCCAGRKLDVISRCKPKLVITVGNDSLSLMETYFGNSFDLVEEPDLLMPTNYKGHKFWLWPIVGTNEAFMDMNEIQGIMLTHFKKIWNRASATPTVFPTEDYYKGMELILNPREVKAAFKDLASKPLVANDIETTCLRPYKKDAQLLTTTFSTFDRTFVFPLQHPQTPGRFKYEEVLEETYNLTKTTELIFHNGTFEQEWYAEAFGWDWLYQTLFKDTMAQAYILNSRTPKSLGYLTRRYFGFDVKKLSSIDVENLINEPLEVVMQYNGLDAKFTKFLHDHQLTLLEALDLLEVYLMQNTRISSCVLMQAKGALPNFDFAVATHKKLSGELEELKLKFSQLPDVKKARVKYGQCNPLSNANVAQLLHDTQNIRAEITGVGEEFLESLPKCDEIDLILQIRDTNKTVSTYLTGYLPGGKFIHDDGLIHSSFNCLLTNTGRLSSSEPNLQNLQSRGGKKGYRDIIEAPPGMLMVEIDAGQVEYRVAAALSEDEFMRNGLLNDFDVHAHWTQRGIELLGAEHFGIDPNNQDQFNALRGTFKNALVFPAIYGSVPYSIAQNLKVPDHRFSIVEYLMEEEFWTTHHGIRTWQKKEIAYLEKHKHIKTVFGRKFFNLHKLKALNYPIQSAASDVIESAHARLTEKAIREGNLHLIPFLNIHDSLIFVFPENKLNDYLYIVLCEMLHTASYDWWLKGIPLTMEVSMGTKLGSLKKFGTFSSTEFRNAA